MASDRDGAGVSLRRWAPRLLAAGALALVALYLLYLGGANALLRSAWLPARLNEKPEHLLVRYAAAWTVWPGLVHVRGLSIREQSRVTQWQVAIDEAWVALDLPRLARRQLAATALRGSGVSFRLRRRPEPSMAATTAPGSPEIAGLALTEAPPRPTAAETAEAARQSWRITLRNVELERLREVWISGYRFAGDARVAGGFDLQPERWLALDTAHVEIPSGALSLAGRPVLGSMAGDVVCDLGGFRPEDAGDGGFLRQASGRLRLAGAIPDLGFLQPYLQQVRWIQIGGTSGAWRADLRASHGRYLAGSHLEARPRQVTARLDGDDEAWGTGRVSWDATSEGDGGRGSLVAAFDELQLRRPGSATPRAHGRGLRIEVATRGLALADLPTPVGIAVTLPPAEVGDFSSYNVYLPHGAGLQLRAGTGQVQGWLRAAAPAWQGDGEVDLAGRRVEAVFQGHRLRGNLHVHSRFRALPRERQLALAASDVEISEVNELPAAGGAAAAGPAPGAGGRAGASPAAAGWWARAHLVNGAVRPGAAVYLAARITATLSDARPLMAIFPPDRRRLLGWLDRIMDLRGIQATGDLQAGRDSVALDGTATAGSNVEMRARLRFAGGRRDGDLYAAFGPLSVGLELSGGDRHWKLVGARRWFDSRTAPAAPHRAAR
jgi:hypothetical protein